MAITDSTLTYGIELWSNAFTQTRLFSWMPLLSIAIIFLTLLLISRDPEQWKRLAFPVSIAWMITGIKVHVLIILILGIQWTVHLFSQQIIGTIMTVKETPQTLALKAEQKLRERKYAKELSDTTLGKTLKEKTTTKAKKVIKSIPGIITTIKPTIRKSPTTYIDNEVIEKAYRNK